MMSRLAWLAAALGAAGWVYACSSDDPAPVGPGGMVGDDAGTQGGDGSVEDGGGGEGDAASGDAGAGTSLVVDINGKQRPVDRAQFGDELDAGTKLLHIEAHFGGNPECPTMGSVSPDRTVIIDAVPAATAGQTFTKADGIAVGFLDFNNEQLVGKPTTGATAATVKIVAIDLAAKPAFVTLDVDATFPEGTVKGRAHASYCESMSLK